MNCNENSGSKNISDYGSYSSIEELKKSTSFEQKIKVEENQKVVGMIGSTAAVNKDYIKNQIIS